MQCEAWAVSGGLSFGRARKLIGPAVPRCMGRDALPLLVGMGRRRYAHGFLFWGFCWLELSCRHVLDRRHQVTPAQDWSPVPLHVLVIPVPVVNCPPVVELLARTAPPVASGPTFPVHTGWFQGQPIITTAICIWQKILSCGPAIM
jgi:hypothetical protein